MHTVGETTSSVPAFLGKLWKLVEDPSTNHLISWNTNGVSFTIRDQARFARELLPLYYKHNNMASFVRQLNMYGFHKVVSVDSGGLKLDKDEMEFAHMYFLQGQEFLLEHIKRKIPISKQDDGKHTKPEVLTRILAEVRGMKGKQESVDSRLNTMKQENEALWREVASLRQKHMKQQQIVNKLIQFLISIVQPNGRTGLGLKRRYPLMLGEATHSASTSSGVNGAGKGDGPKSKSDAKLKDLSGLDLSSAPTISLLSGSGPVIHDVTDIMDEASNAGLIDDEDEGNVVELTDSPHQSPVEILPQTLATDLTDLPVSNEAAAIQNASIDVALDGELSATDQPDFNTMVELETGPAAGSNLLEKAIAGMASPSPLSPELLNAVDPREINSGALLTFEESRKGNEAAKTETSKKPDLSVAVGEVPIMEREELDNHLDTMQMDLDQLREVLSLQGSPMDANALLGVCDTWGLSFESTLGVDGQFSWGLSSPVSPSTASNWRNTPSDNQLSSHPLASLLEQQLLPKLFSTDDCLSSSNYMSGDADMFRTSSNGAITGNEVIAYSYPGLFEDGQAPTLTEGNGQSNSQVEKETTDLFDFLAEPQTSATVSPTKKKKKN